jgi:2-succinyl-6-hydroxy-2,4-cyclohexadiene-1-carboxylate synthase
LAERCRVIAVDLLGHGSSDAPPQAGRYAMPRVAADIAALLDHLGVGAGAPCRLLDGRAAGALSGAGVAGTLALADPGEQLAGAGDSGGARPGVLASDEAAGSLYRGRRDRRRSSNNWERLPLFASQEMLPAAVRAQQRWQRLQNRPAGLAGSLRGMGTGVQPALWGRLPELALPALLLAGALDKKFVAIAQKMARLIPGATLAMVPGAGHTIHLEQPEVVVAGDQRMVGRMGKR